MSSERHMLMVLRSSVSVRGVPMPARKLLSSFTPSTFTSLSMLMAE